MAAESVGPFDAIWDPVCDWDGGGLPETLALCKGQELQVEFSTQAGWSYGQTVPVIGELLSGWFPTKFTLRQEVLDAVRREDERRREAMRLEQRRMGLWCRMGLWVHRMTKERALQRVRQLRVAEKRVAVRASEGARLAAFGDWKENAQHEANERKRLLHLKVKVLARLGSVLLVTGMERWRGVVEE
ncbi:hypothetical protein T484DRAFT_1902626, partial [Baffinella frigidus]